jgi:hypothetical protein
MDTTTTSTQDLPAHATRAGRVLFRVATKEEAMTLAEFRRLTAHLAGERELLCAGVPVGLLWHDETDVVSIDDDAMYPIGEEGTECTVLCRQSHTKSKCYETCN